MPRKHSATSTRTINEGRAYRAAIREQQLKKNASSQQMDSESTKSKKIVIEPCLSPTERRIRELLFAQQNAARRSGKASIKSANALAAHKMQTVSDGKDSKTQSDENKTK